MQATGLPENDHRAMLQAIGASRFRRVGTGWI